MDFSEKELKRIFSRLFSNASSRSSNVAETARQSIAKFAKKHPTFTFSYISEVMNKNPPISEEDSAALIVALSNSCEEIETEKIAPIFLFLQSKSLNFASKPVIFGWKDLCSKFIKTQKAADIVDQLQFSSNLGVLSLAYCTRFHPDSLEKYFSQHKVQLFQKISPFVLSIFFGELCKSIENPTETIIQAFIYLLSYDSEHFSLVISQNLLQMITKISRDSSLLRASEITSMIIEKFQQRKELYEYVLPILFQLSYTEEIARKVHSFAQKVYTNGFVFQLNDISKKFPIESTNPVTLSRMESANCASNLVMQLLGARTDFVLGCLINEIDSTNGKPSVLSLFCEVLEKHEFTDEQYSRISSALSRITTKNMQPHSSLMLCQILVCLIRKTKVKQEQLKLFCNFITHVAVRMNTGFFIISLTKCHKENVASVIDIVCEKLFEAEIIPAFSQFSYVMITLIGELNPPLAEEHESSEENPVIHPFSQVLVRRSLQDKAICLLRVFSNILAKDNRYTASLIALLSVFIEFVFPLANMEEMFAAVSNNKDEEKQSLLIESMIMDCLKQINDRQFHIGISTSIIQELETSSVSEHAQNCIKILSILVHFLPEELNSTMTKKVYEVLPHNENLFANILLIIENSPSVFPLFVQAIEKDCYSCSLIRFLSKNLPESAFEASLSAILKMYECLSSKKEIPQVLIIAGIGETCRRITSGKRQAPNFVFKKYHNFFEYMVNCLTKVQTKEAKIETLAAINAIILVPPFISKKLFTFFTEKILKSGVMQTLTASEELFNGLKDVLVSILRVLPDNETLSVLMMNTLYLHVFDSDSFVFKMISIASGKEEDVKLLGSKENTKMVSFEHLLSGLLAVENEQSVFYASELIKLNDGNENRANKTFDSIESILSVLDQKEIDKMFSFSFDLVKKGRMSFGNVLSSIIKTRKDTCTAEKVIQDVFSKKYPISDSLFAVVSSLSPGLFLKKLVSASTKMMMHVSAIKECATNLMDRCSSWILKLPEDMNVISMSLIIASQYADKKLLAHLFASIVVYSNATKKEIDLTEIAAAKFNSKEPNIVAFIRSDQEMSVEGMNFLMSNACLEKPQIARSVSWFCGSCASEANYGLFIPTLISLNLYDGTLPICLRFLSTIVRAKLEKPLLQRALSTIRDCSENGKEINLTTKCLISLVEGPNECSGFAVDCLVNIASKATISAEVLQLFQQKVKESGRLNALLSTLQPKQLSASEEDIIFVSSILLGGTQQSVVNGLKLLLTHKKAIESLKDEIEELTNSKNDDVAILAMNAITELLSE